MQTYRQRGTQGQYNPGGASGSTPLPTSVLQKGRVALVAGTQSYAITFSPAFATIPTFFGAGILMVNNSGEEFEVAADFSTLTASGVTVWLNSVPTAASTGAYINWMAAL